MITMRTAMRGLALAALLPLGACMGAGSHMSGYSSDPLASVAIVHNPDFNGGRISPQAYDTIVRYGQSCDEQIGRWSPSATSNAAQGAVNYGIPGAAGAALGGAAGFSGDAGNYAAYGGPTAAFGGAVNGLYTGSYSRNAAEGDCVRQFWGDVEDADPAFRGTHVVTMFSGSRPPPRDSAPATTAPSHGSNNGH